LASPFPMKVKVLSSLAGDTFAYRRGEIVDADLFKDQVGTGWEALAERLPDSSPTVTQPKRAK